MAKNECVKDVFLKNFNSKDPNEENTDRLPMEIHLSRMIMLCQSLSTTFHHESVSKSSHI
jgi:hypothetical protein